MAIIDDHTRHHIKEFFADLKDNVTLYFFHSKSCQTCKEIEEILEVLEEESGGKIKVEKHDFDTEKAAAKVLGVKLAPAIVVHGKEKYNIKFYGIPSGYEFRSLLEAIMDASHGDTDLHPQLAEKVKNINDYVEILVFITPTCPYCPMAVRSAHKYALLNKKIDSAMIEAMEFEELSLKYNVMAVPKVVIRVDGEDKEEFEGAYPDQKFIEKIYEAIEK